jgi:hypothetical protein
VPIAVLITGRTNEQLTGDKKEVDICFENKIRFLNPLPEFLNLQLHEQSLHVDVQMGSTHGQMVEIVGRQQSWSNLGMPAKTRPFDCANNWTDTRLAHEYTLATVIEALLPHARLACTRPWPPGINAPIARPHAEKDDEDVLEFDKPANASAELEIGVIEMHFGLCQPIDNQVRYNRKWVEYENSKLISNENTYFA